MRYRIFMDDEPLEDVEYDKVLTKHEMELECVKYAKDRKVSPVGFGMKAIKE